MGMSILSPSHHDNERGRVDSRKWKTEKLTKRKDQLMMPPCRHHTQQHRQCQRDDPQRRIMRIPKYRLQRLPVPAEIVFAYAHAHRKPIKFIVRD